ncbi:MAG: hypothetical protein HY717_03575 [Planctomycetes bacterium]|nr:hypothetical protein [Planctomycetota bacterium]
MKTPPDARFTLNFDYLSTVLAGWLIPGAGHWILGQRARAAILFAAVNATFWIGQYLGDFRPVNRAIHPIFFWGQVGNGLGTLVSNYLWGEKRTPPPGVDRTLPPLLNTGILFTSIAGLLNLLLVLHLADPKTWLESMRRPGEERRKAPGEP